MKSIIFFLSITLFAGLSQARVLEPEKRALIDQMLELSGGDQVTDYMAQMLSIQMISMLQKQFGQIDEAVAHIVLDEAKTIMYEEYVLNNRMNEIFYALYDEAFSIEDLQAMTEFFATDLGKRALRELPMISGKSQQQAKEHGKTIGPKAQARIMERLKKLSQELSAQN